MKIFLAERWELRLLHNRGRQIVARGPNLTLQQKIFGPWQKLFTWRGPLGRVNYDSCQGTSSVVLLLALQNLIVRTWMDGSVQCDFDIRDCCFFPMSYQQSTLISFYHDSDLSLTLTKYSRSSINHDHKLLYPNLNQVVLCLHLWVWGMKKILCHCNFIAWYCDIVNFLENQLRNCKWVKWTDSVVCFSLIQWTKYPTNQDSLLHWCKNHYQSY